MDKRMTAVILTAALLIIGMVLFAGCRGKTKTDPDTMQVQEPQVTLNIVEETGKPATRAADTLPLVTEAPEPVSSVTEAGTESAETAGQTTATAKSKKNKKKKTTTAALAEDSYVTEALTETEALTVDVTIDKDGVYTTKDDVALYIYTYGELPSNFITKKEAQKLGWTGGSLEPYAPGCCIGGSAFGNYEGKLPEKSGRTYTECDIDTLGKKSRGPKRIVFSNDGLIYYTGDHYETFELLYGEE